MDLRTLAIVWLVTLFAPALAVEPEDVKQEQEALQGYWVPVRYEQGLTLFEDTGFGNFSAEIDEQTWINRYESGHLWVWRYSIDPTTNPKRIDFEGRRQVGPDGLLEPYVRLGIYEIEGDRLKLCFSAVEPVQPKHRPTDFSADPGSGRIVTIFERADSPAAGGPDQQSRPQQPSLERSSLPAPAQQPPGVSPDSTSSLPATVGPGVTETPCPPR